MKYVPSAGLSTRHDPPSAGADRPHGTLQAFQQTPLALDGLTPSERERLNALAAAVGLQTENLLLEIQAQTLAARADIETTAAVARRMRAGRLHGRVLSEHAAPGFASRIEVRHALCPLARLASLRR